MKMPRKTIALPARAAGRAAQRGITLIELMIGITLGLLVVAVAVATLLISRGISGTVSDASGIQQQSAYALRLIGGQLRQAASMRLNVPLDAGADTPSSTTDPMALVAFEAKSGAGANAFDATTPTGRADLLGGTASDATDTLTTGFARDQIKVFVPPSTANPATMAVNCVGGPADSAANAGVRVVQSAFSVNDNHELQCDGKNGGKPQPVIQNVANFKARYLVQDTGTPGTPKIRLVTADDVADAAQVQGVEVCLVLYGKEVINMPGGSTYTDCDGSDVDMTTLPGARRSRMHMVFRNVFQLRSMGVM